MCVEWNPEKFEDVFTKEFLTRNTPNTATLSQRAVRAKKLLEKQRKPSVTGLEAAVLARSVVAPQRLSIKKILAQARATVAVTAEYRR